ncbi:MAG: UTP--glucose-1-phosphate uridylyltransferase GalU [Sulfurimonas sp.]|nr:UTP--glucose-1-phosphate uridylyltransferase GalU [Sulfurimonas sp.]
MPNDNTRIRKCLFPAAGYGTRFLPATKAIPKEMLPVLTKPLLQYGVEEAISAKMSTMAIVTGRGKRAIEDHFDISYELEHQIKGTSKEHYLTEIRKVITNCTFSYTRQIEMKGLGHAILCGETLIGDEPFAVILADDLCDNDGESVLSQMTKLYEKYKCSIVAVEEIPPKDSNKYGVIAGDVISHPELDSGSLVRVTDMVEKPSPENAPSNLAIIGRYILTPDIFDIIKDTKPGKGGEIQITDALLTQAKQGKVIAYKFKGKRFDCGSVDGFVEATNYFYKKNNSSKNQAKDGKD